MSYIFFSFFVLSFLLFSKRNTCFFLKRTKEQLPNLSSWNKQNNKLKVLFFIKPNDALLLGRKSQKLLHFYNLPKKNKPIFLEAEKGQNDWVETEKDQNDWIETEKDQNDWVKTKKKENGFNDEMNTYSEKEEIEKRNLVKSSEQLLKGQYTDKEFCDILSTCFLSYANFLILNRCLCDYRDGLKKVQRRIIWSMYEISKGNRKGIYKKCARIVGEVIGKYHPHGDKSVYDALVRLAQKHHNNNLLIKGYGNFGTIEFNAAAMRYTEAKISNFCFDVLLNEVNDENIEYISNFDGNEKEPKVFCSKIPLLLVNGCSGIAVSVLTNIPCHNLIDVINCTINFLFNKDATEEQLFSIIKGPDFPTGGIITSKKNVLQNIYKNGKGNIVIRSNVFLEYTKNGKTYTTHINNLLSLNPTDLEKENKKLIIRNLPPNVKPNELILNLVELLNEKKNEYDNILSKIRDESEKEEMRIVLELKRHSQIEQIHNLLLFLFKNTQMEINYHCNFVCIGHQNSYTQFSLKSFLNFWCEHRIEFIKKNYEIKNRHLLKELNIIELYLIIQKKIVEIINFFQKEQDLEKIKNYLKENFQLNEEQIKHILSMKIQKLINIKNVNFEKFREQILEKMKLNDEVINNKENIKKIMIDELLYIRNKYGIRKENTNVTLPPSKYKYAYLNKEKQIQPQWFDITMAKLNKIENVNFQISKEEKELRQKEQLIKVSEEEKLKNYMNSGEYRKTYIDTAKEDEQEIYSKEEILILLTQGGYIKKIKITEKLKKHLNNIIKLANVKYILKENEEYYSKGDEEKKRDTLEGQLEETEEKEREFNKEYFENSEKKQNNMKSNKYSNNRSEKNIYKIKKSIFVKNNDKLLITDSRNKAFILNISDIPISSYDSKGVAISQFIKSTNNITGLIKFDENKKYLVVCSESGKLKIIKNDIFLKKLRKGVTLFKNINTNNIYFSYCNRSDNCIVGTKNGLILQFPLSNFKISKKNSTGNKCISLNKNDKVVDLVTYENTEKNFKNLKIIFLSKNGLGKMISVEELKLQKKKGKGYQIMRFKKKKKSNNQQQQALREKEKEELTEKKKTETENGQKDNVNSDELLSFKLYDASKKKENDILIMITDHAVLIRKNTALLKKKSRNHSSHIYAKLNKLNKLIYFDIM